MKEININDYYMRIVDIEGGRVGMGTEWEETIFVDSDATDEDIEHYARGFSDDFMMYILEDEEDKWDYWYEWKERERNVSSNRKS